MIFKYASKLILVLLLQKIWNYYHVDGNVKNRINQNKRKPWNKQNVLNLTCNKILDFDIQNIKKKKKKNMKISETKHYGAM